MIPPERYDSLGELLRDALVQFKTETALIEVNRKREAARLSYLDFTRAAEPLARRLQDHGVGPGDRVAIVMSNQSKWLVSAYAALFRGAVLVPIDYKLTGPEQVALLAHCRPSVLVTEYPAFRSMPGLEVPLVLVTEVPEGTDLSADRSGATVAERWEDTPSDRPPPDFVPRARSDQATLVYSSGTGGRPKGCILTHDNYLEQYRTLTQLFPLRTGHRYFSILPTNHAIDFMVGFVGPLAGGATVVHQRALRPEMINDTLRRYRITHMAIVPLLLEAFERRIDEQLDTRSPVAQQAFGALTRLNAALTLGRPRRHLSRRLLKPVHDAFGGHLELLFCGGAFVDRDRAQRFYDLGIPVVIGYGLTEACTVLTVNDLNPFRADSAGRPLDGVELDIRGADPRTGVGEVWARSRTVFAGYLDDAEQTAEALHGGWLRTGDLGYLDASGHLHLVGRAKNMIVTAGGKNIYPEDIESAFEGVPCDELAVFSSEYLFPGGALTGERLVAVVRAGAPDDAAAALRERNGRLPDFKRVRGLLLWPDAFPRTASMKVKREPLAEAIRAKLDARAIASI
ncbi:MAG: AMP-binding protein [Myxococcales bacterium]|nr:AMP-binding protein [Myxococcales bacterium]